MKHQILLSLLILWSVTVLSACGGSGSSSGGGMEVVPKQCFKNASEWRRQHNRAHAILGGCVSLVHPECTREKRQRGWRRPATEFHANSGRNVKACYSDAELRGSAEGFPHG